MRPTSASVEAFLDAIPDESRRAECRAVAEIMRRATGVEPVMWGTNIVGFGSYHYRYNSGREGDWFLTGFSPRKKELTLYIVAGFEAFTPLMSRLGRYKTGKSCLYLRSLDDVDRETLEDLIGRSAREVAAKYSETKPSRASK
ncbi:MAG TPA: DUF1801 domain-containing protein [Thermoanaerobaculia bacterium]|nr:DUF1801 domain-containing protein [Thermoanaerobaculia bacterium]